MRGLFLPAALLFVALGAEAANFSSSAIGTTAAGFLNLGAGARALALGGAYSAAADDATSLYWNPAAMTQVPKRSLALMHTVYFASSYYDYASYVHNMGGAGAFGLGAQYLAFGSINETDENFQSIGKVAPYDLAASAGYAYKFGSGYDFENGFSLGVAGKYIESRLLDTAKTQAVDLGFLSPRFFDDRLRLAAAAQNIGGTLKYDQKAEPLPTAFRAGAALRLLPGWLVAVDGVAPRNDRPYVNAGTEYVLVPGDWWRVAGRAGFSSQNIAPSCGLGIGYRGFNVDYAFVLYGELGDVHRISLTFNF